MVTLTEQQRQDAIRACGRIEQIYAEQQVALQNIVRIFDNLANGRDPNDGVVKFEKQDA